jgi:hypothetical protein
MIYCAPIGTKQNIWPVDECLSVIMIELILDVEWSGFDTNASMELNYRPFFLSSDLKL